MHGRSATDAHRISACAKCKLNCHYAQIVGENGMERETAMFTIDSLLVVSLQYAACFVQHVQAATQNV